MAADVGHPLVRRFREGGRLISKASGPEEAFIDKQLEFLRLQIEAEYRPVPALLHATQAPYRVFWTVPGASFSMGYATLERALEAYGHMTASLSVRHASVHHGEDCLHTYDYDPYAWHDIRLLVGR